MHTFWVRQWVVSHPSGCISEKVLKVLLARHTCYSRRHSTPLGVSLSAASLVASTHNLRASSVAASWDGSDCFCPSMNFLRLHYLQDADSLYTDTTSLRHSMRLAAAGMQLPRHIFAYESALQSKPSWHMLHSNAHLIKLPRLLSNFSDYQRQR